MAVTSKWGKGSKGYGSSGGAALREETAPWAQEAPQAHENVHSLTSVQLGACVDSLRRAVSSAEAASNLCAKASRAFQEEVLTIRQCQSVLESYLHPQSAIVPAAPSMPSWDDRAWDSMPSSGWESGWESRHR